MQGLCNEVLIKLSSYKISNDAKIRLLVENISIQVDTTFTRRITLNFTASQVMFLYHEDHPKFVSVLVLLHFLILANCMAGSEYRPCEPIEQLLRIINPFTDKVIYSSISKLLENYKSRRGGDISEVLNT